MPPCPVCEGQVQVPVRGRIRRAGIGCEDCGREGTYEAYAAEQEHWLGVFLAERKLITNWRGYGRAARGS